MFQRRWRELGHANLHIDSRWGGGDAKRTRTYAADLVRSKPDVLIADFNAQLFVLSRATRTIPIVFVGASDPVGASYVASLPSLGGNITGFTLYEPSLAGKWPAVLRDAAPTLRRVSLFVNPDSAVLRGTLYTHALDAAARSIGVESAAATVYAPADIDAVFKRLGQDAGNSVIVAPDTFSETNGDRIVAMAAAHRIPTVFAIRRFAQMGGLMSYGPDTFDAVARAAAYVDRTLQGERPAVLPVQSPTKFELIVNLKTANALGLTISPNLLAQADEIVE